MAPETSPVFRGVFTALVTPMDQGQVCFEDLDALVEWQITAGIDGLVPVGTTGESPTLSHEEHIEVIRRTVDRVHGRVPVIAGTGSNATKEAVALTQAADQAGADGILAVAPYYNKPSQEGLCRHFSALAEATDKPIVLYSIPSRCGIEIGVETISRLAKRFSHVRTIKESGGSCDRVAALLDACGDTVTVLSGDDGLTVPFLSLGAQGVISVASNLVVRDMVSMVKSALANDFASARALTQKYYRLFCDLFIEANPVPVKYALHRAGRIRSPEIRLPLCPLSHGSRAALDKTLNRLQSPPTNF